MANQVAEALFEQCQCDDDGNEFVPFKQILDHKSGPDAVQKEDAFIRRTDCSRPPQRKRTTKGWSLLVEWADKSMRRVVGLMKGKCSILPIPWRRPYLHL